MANRSFIKDSWTLVKGEVRLYAAVSVGAAGAVTLQKWNYPTLGAGQRAGVAPLTYSAAPTTAAGQGWPTLGATGAEGVRSVTRTGAGLWTVQLQDGYQRCFGVDISTQNATGIPTIVACGIGSAISMNATNGATIPIGLISATGVAADPADGDLILLTIKLQNASEP